MTRPISLVRLVVLALVVTTGIPFMILFAKLYMDHVNTTTTTTNTIDELTVMTNTLASLKKNLTALHYESDFTRANKMPGGNITAIDHEIVRTKRDIVAVSFQIAEANHEMRIKNSLRKTRGYRGSNHMVTAKKPPRKVTVDPLRMAMLERARMKIDDKHLDKLAYYMIRDATNISMLLTARGIENTAALNVAAKGFYVVASSQSGSSDALDEHKVIGLDKEPFHSFYRYTHKYADPCLLHYISLKYDPDCGDSLGTRYIRPLLIVSVQRSGSHYAWEMLNRLGIHVHHEGIGPDGAVSWLYAINANTLRLRVPPRAGRPRRGRNYVPSSNNTTTTAAAAAADTVVPASGRWKDSPTYGTFGIFVRTGYAINNPEKISVHRFRVVLHQVRHPLRVINTIVKRCPSWDKFWRWIAYARGMQGITKNQSPLRRAMLLYILWNKHIERYADIRFKSETTSPKTICLLGGFKERCNGTSGSDAQIIEPVNEPENEEEGEEGEEEEEGEVAEEGEEEVGKDSPGQTPIPISSTQLNVTWTDIEKEDKQLANELKIMCVEYGYDLDPDKIPQNEDTKQFTA